MENCTPCATPWEFGKYIDKRRKDEAASDKEKFQSAIGCLIYVATATRPEISAAVNAHSQFKSDLSMDHWTGMKRILQHVKGTTDYGIEFTANKKVEITGYSDTDWAGDIVN